MGFDTKKDTRMSNLGWIESSETHKVRKSERWARLWSRCYGEGVVECKSSFGEGSMLDARDMCLRRGDLTRFPAGKSGSSMTSFSAFRLCRRRSRL